MEKLTLVKKEGERTGIYRDKEGRYWRVDFSSSPAKIEELEGNVQEENIPPFRPEAMSEEEIRRIVREEVEKGKKKLKELLSLDEKELKKELLWYSSPDHIVSGQIREGVVSRFKRFILPHRILLTTDMYGRTGWRAFLKYSEPVPTVWEGIEEQEDVVSIGETPERWYAPTFYTASKKTTELIKKTLQDYIVLDCNDFKGHALGAIVSSGIHPESPDPEWNDLVEKYHRKIEEMWKNERRKSNEKMLKKYEEFLEMNKEKIDELEIRDKIEEIMNRVKEEVDNDGILTDFELRKMQRILEEAERIKQEKEYRETLIRDARNNNRPLFHAEGKWGKSFTVYARDFQIKGDRAFISVPKDLIPHFIGREGSGLQTYKTILRVKKIIVKDLPPLGTKIKSVYRINL